MDLYLNAGFGKPLGGATLRLISDLGLNGIRQDLRVHQTDDEIVTLVTEFRGFPLRPLFVLSEHLQQVAGEPLHPRALADHARRVTSILIRTGMLEHQGGVPILEPGNEPDLGAWAREPSRFAAAVQLCRDAVRRLAGDAIPIITGGISNLGHDSLIYLARAVMAGIPDDVIIGYHRYPVDISGPKKAHKSFSSRAAEFLQLHEIAGTRQIACTETGYHLAKQPAGCFGLFRRKWTEYQQMVFTEAELRFHHDAGALLTTMFQLNDGPEETKEHRFGIRRFDGTFRPVAKAMREMAAELSA